MDLVISLFLVDCFLSLASGIERSEIRRPQLFVSVWFQILFHSPHRGAFHLSLTVLVHYRSPIIFSLGSLVLPASHRISRVPWYLRNKTSKAFEGPFRLPGSHRLWQAVPGRFNYGLVKPFSDLTN